jgi:hypothetical protein
MVHHFVFVTTGAWSIKVAKLAAQEDGEIMKTEIAQHLSDELNDIVGRLDGTIQLVMEHGSDAEFQGYKRVVAFAMAAVIDVINPLYIKNPEVKPEDYDG